MKHVASPVLVAIVLTTFGVGIRGQSGSSFDIVEASISELQLALDAGRVTSRQLVQLYIDRINRYNGRINAVAHLSRTALNEAEALDRERAAGRIRGPLHGIPVAVKDIINTNDMPTTGGAVAFEGIVPPYKRSGCRESTTRRRDHLGKDDPDRARQLGDGGYAGQLQWAFRVQHESL